MKTLYTTLLSLVLIMVTFRIGYVKGSATAEKQIEEITEQANEKLNKLSREANKKIEEALKLGRRDVAESYM